MVSFPLPRRYKPLDSIISSSEREIFLSLYSLFDAPETVIERLRVYHDQTEPLKDYYEKAGKLRLVEGQEQVADTTALTLAALKD